MSSSCTLELGGKFKNREECLDDRATQCEGPWIKYGCGVDQTCALQRLGNYGAEGDCRCQFIVVPLVDAHVTIDLPFKNGTVKYYQPVASANAAKNQGGGGFNSYTKTWAKGQLFVAFDSRLNTSDSVGDSNNTTDLWIDVPIPSDVKRNAIAANAHYVYIWFDQQNFMLETDVVTMTVNSVTPYPRLPFSGDPDVSNQLYHYDVGLLDAIGDTVMIQIHAVNSTQLESIGSTPAGGKLIINMVAFSKFPNLTMSDLKAFYDPPNPNAARFSAGRDGRPERVLHQRMYVGSRGALMFS